MNSVFRVALRQFSTAGTKRAGGEVPQGKETIITRLAITDILLGYKLLKEKQKMFNLDNGLRVHERGGMVDSVLYNFTLLLMAVGGVFWGQTVYTLAFPQKN